MALKYQILKDVNKAFSSCLSSYGEKPGDTVSEDNTQELACLQSP